MNILVIDCGSSRVPSIVSSVEKAGAECEVKKLTECRIHEKYNGVIISGAPVLLTQSDPKPVLEKIELLLNSSIPVLGICFGHQLLGLFHGAKISLCNEDRDWQTVILKKYHRIFEGLDEKIKVREDHCECITVPPGFECLAESVTCGNEAMVHTEKPLIGLQFHPEASEKTGDIIFGNFLNICKNPNRT